MTRKNKTQAVVVTLPSNPKPSEPKKKKKANKPRMPNAGVTKLVKQVCAITDPFCEGAVGSKWPDESNAKSLAVTIRGTLPLQTTAAGLAAAVFVPVWAYGYQTHTSFAGNVATFANLSAFAGTSSFSPANARLVSGGIKITGIGAPLSASGTLSICHLNSDDVTDLTTLDIIDPNAQQIDYYGIPALTEKQISVVFKSAGPGSRLYNPPLSANVIATTNTNYWQPILIGINGGAASTYVIRIEYVLHFELQFAKGNAMNLVATPAAVTNEAATSISSSIVATMGTAVKGGADAVEKAVTKKAEAWAYKMGYRAAGAAAGYILGRGPGASLGYSLADAVDVD